MAEIHKLPVVQVIEAISPVFEAHGFVRVSPAVRTVESTWPPCAWERDGDSARVTRRGRVNINLRRWLDLYITWTSRIELDPDYYPIEGIPSLIDSILESHARDLAGRRPF